MSLTAIIIPCYNEAKRLAPSEITGFLKQHAGFHFLFVDDGSTDNTGRIIERMKNENSGQLFTLKLELNKGKATAVREGFLFALLQKKYSFIGYWDADLSTNFSELLRLVSIIENEHLDFAFGSRMKKLNATIHRSMYRHITGRMITTAIDTYFDLGIYDTQCGAKVFSASLAEIISKEPFVSEWLFDVEIFLRIRNLKTAVSGEEVPLKSWTSRKDSKITILDAPSLFLQFIKLIQTYPAKEKGNG